MNGLNTQWYDEEWIRLNNFIVEVQRVAREKAWEQRLIEWKDKIDKIKEVERE